MSDLLGLSELQLSATSLSEFIIGFGGSTVSDFGLGLAISLGVKFYDVVYSFYYA